MRFDLIIAMLEQNSSQLRLNDLFGPILCQKMINDLKRMHEQFSDIFVKDGFR